jgi:hypothetical protein
VRGARCTRDHAPRRAEADRPEAPVVFAAQGRSRRPPPVAAPVATTQAAAPAAA